MAYADLAAALQGDIPSLSYLLALQHLARAYRDVLDARTWGFLAAEQAYVCPPQVTAGTFAITQGSATVIPNATATAALAAWPATVGLVGCQIRFNASSLYTIATTTPAFTVDRVVAEPTAAASSYQVYRAILPAPTDFKRFDALVDEPNGILIDKERLSYSQAELDAKDPQRSSMGQALILAWVNPLTTLLPRFELWPHPTSGQTFLAHYRRRGLTFSAPTDVQPAIIPDALLTQRAYGWYTYPWAAANAVRLPGLGGNKIAWMNLTLEAKSSYKGLFQTAVREDEAQAPQRIYNRGHGIRGTGGRERLADAAYYQRHSIDW